MLYSMFAFSDYHHYEQNLFDIFEVGNRPQKHFAEKQLNIIDLFFLSSANFSPSRMASYHSSLTDLTSMKQRFCDENAMVMLIWYYATWP